MKPMRDMHTTDLRLADVITQQECRGTVREAEFSTCTVIQIEDDRVKLFRPYSATADFSYTGGVIPYIGVEEYWVEKDSSMLWTIYSRKELK